MCGIAGFYHRERDYGEQEQHYCSLLGRMHQELWRRGPDDWHIPCETLRAFPQPPFHY